MEARNLSSNWKKLQTTLRQTPETKTPAASNRSRHPPARNDLKRKRSNLLVKSSTSNSTVHHDLPTSARKRQKLSTSMSTADQDSQASKAVLSKPDGQIDRVNGGLHQNVDVGKYVALDCEMVGIGPTPHLESALARISVVNYNGDCVYDSYVKPLEAVTDWRTHVSGIAPQHMTHARTLEEVQQQVSLLLKDRIVIGHSVRKDFEVLLLSHPKKDIRDTARHIPYRKLAGGGSPKLKILASELLGLDIQGGEHSSIEDARATMLLFRRDKDAFEQAHAKMWPVRVIAVKEEGDTTTKKPRKRKKKKK